MRIWVHLAAAVAVAVAAASAGGTIAQSPDSASVTAQSDQSSKLPAWVGQVDTNKFTESTQAAITMFLFKPAFVTMVQYLLQSMVQSAQRIASNVVVTQQYFEVDFSVAQQSTPSSYVVVNTAKQRLARRAPQILAGLAGFRSMMGMRSAATEMMLERPPLVNPVRPPMPGAGVRPGGLVEPEPPHPFNPGALRNPSALSEGLGNGNGGGNLLAKPPSSSGNLNAADNAVDGQTGLLRQTSSSSGNLKPPSSAGSAKPGPAEQDGGSLGGQPKNKNDGTDGTTPGSSQAKPRNQESDTQGTGSTKPLASTKDGNPSTDKKVATAGDPPPSPPSPAKATQAEADAKVTEGAQSNPAKPERPWYKDPMLWMIMIPSVLGLLQGVISQRSSDKMMQQSQQQADQLTPPYVLQAMLVNFRTPLIQAAQSSIAAIATDTTSIQALNQDLLSALGVAFPTQESMCSSLASDAAIKSLRQAAVQQIIQNQYFSNTVGNALNDVYTVVQGSVQYATQTAPATNPGLSLTQNSLMTYLTSLNGNGTDPGIIYDSLGLAAIYSLMASQCPSQLSAVLNGGTTDGTTGGATGGTAGPPTGSIPAPSSGNYWGGS